MTPTRIVWYSRNEPLAVQIAELERLFGAVVLLRDPKPFSDADDIIQRFANAQAHELVLVAPLSVIKEVVARGIKPLYAEMEYIPDAWNRKDVDLVLRPRAKSTPERQRHASERLAVRGGEPIRGYKFIRFRRIVGIDIHYEDVVPRERT